MSSPKKEWIIDDTKKYEQLLLRRIESTFALWTEKETITEKELYEFLYKLKRTAGTIGLHKLSALCASQLDILSVDNHHDIPVYSLINFKKMVRELIEETEELILMKTCDVRLDDVFVLIIDDDLEFGAYVKELLGKMGGQVAIASNGKRGLEMFYSTRPNFVLIDVYLPDMEAFDVLDQIADVARARHVPVAMTSINQSKENVIKTYERGAMDFIAKPINTDIFIPYLFNRDEMRKMVDKSIITDGLTGVGNRRHFDEMLIYFAEAYKRTGAQFSLAMLDIDYFKKVNDLYGHPAGDKVLRELRKIAKRVKRDTDYVFRYGGEEFALITTGTTADKASILVDRIRAEFSEKVFQEGDQSFSVQFSAGIAAFENDAEELISHADQALYLAKRTGRNKTVLYHSETVVIKRKLNIIVVDDDTLIRTMLYEKLSEWKMADIDITVQTFADGPSFLEADWYSSEESYIVLLDGIMPEMDGLAVLGHLKSKYTESNVIIAMITARTSESDIKAALWLDADDYIMKPFKPDDVLMRIQQLANRLFN